MSHPPVAAHRPHPDALVRDATRAAQAASKGAGVEIHEVEEPPELEEVSRLLSVVWNREVASRQITPELLRALTTTGNYVAGAFLDGELIGASVAFFAAPELNSLHSHITGVAEADVARGVGYALKLHQRAWALRRGIETITWTFDPLVRRNAFFNIAKLRADAVAYLPNFYGEMRDLINAGDQTDRLLVEWRLGGPEVVAVCDHHLAPPGRDEEPFEELLSVDVDGRPGAGAWKGGAATVAVPADIESMRLGSPGLAREWRRTLRDVLGGAMTDGDARVAGFLRSDGYLLERNERHPRGEP